MQVVKKENTIKIQLTQKQEQKLRRKLACFDRPIQYAGAALYAQGGSWYEIIACPKEYDWASEQQMMKALLRKIRSILSVAPAVASVVPAPFVDAPTDEVDRHGRVKPTLVSSNKVTVRYGEPEVAPVERLQHLAKVVNSKYHR